jgi:hypothetical protein
MMQNGVLRLLQKCGHIYEGSHVLNKENVIIQPSKNLLNMLLTYYWKQVHTLFNCF